MTAVLEGVRILEVAEHTFVPAASALLADWGAEIIKIEHVERGDAMRGLASTGVAVVPDDVHILLEHSNRGKKSLGLDLASPEGLDILHRLVATCDVFLTNKLPERARAAEDRRRRDPGPQPEHRLRAGHRPGRARSRRRQGLLRLAGLLGPLRHRGRRQAPRVRPRAGPAGARLRRLHRRHDHRRRDHGRPLPPRAHRRGDHRRRVAARHGAVGDGPGDGAVAGARHARGRPPPADQDGQQPAVPQLHDEGRPDRSRSPASRPASTGRRCARSIGRPELATDPRFADHASLLENNPSAVEVLDEVFAAATLDEWRERLAPFIGQWAVVQDTLEAAGDPQTVANGYLAGLRDRRAAPRSSSSPRRSSTTSSRRCRRGRRSSTSTATRSSTELGLDMDAIIDLKVRGVVA